MTLPPFPFHAPFELPPGLALWRFGTKSVTTAVEGHRSPRR